MSFSGGVYTLPGPALVTGEVVSATENNQFRNDVAGAFNVTMLRNGTSTATANLPMGGYKLTGLGVATTSGDALSYGQAAVISDFTASGTVTISSGTANGVAYLNGSKVLTTGSALTFDGGMLALSGSGNIARFGDGTNTFDLRFRGANNWSIQYAPSTDEWALQRNSVNQYSANSSSHIWSLLAAEQMRLTSTGLGIGTSSPSYKLDVTGNIRAGGVGNGILFDTTGASATSSISTTNDYWLTLLSSRGTGSKISLTNDTGIRFYGVQTTEQMRLDTSGNLGLGVTPSAWNTGSKALELNAAAFSGYSNSEAQMSQNAYLGASGWVYKNSYYAMLYTQTTGQHRWYTAPSGTAGNAVTFTQAMTLDASGNLLVGSSTAPASAQVKLLVNNASGNGGIQMNYGAGTGGSALVPANGAGLIFYTYTGAIGSESYSERMRIDSSGNLLVGATVADETTTGIKLLPGGATYFVRSESTNANSTCHVYSTGAAAYRFYVGMGGTVYATNTTISAISDQRYKENIRDLDVGLDAVMALKPRAFDWKAGKGKDIKNDRGFIAQEFEQVFPDLIDEWKDPAPEGEEPYKSVRQDLIPVLVKAIQELKAELDATKAEVAALKGA